MVKLIDEENLQLDVVSEGELYTALEAGFDSKTYSLPWEQQDETRDSICIR